MFSIPSYNTIGDEYDKKITPSGADARTKGAQLKCAATGHLFEGKCKSLHEGDKYVDPGVLEKKDRLEKMKKNLTPEGFKYSNPPKKSAGLGSHFGTFDGGIKHETEYIVLKKGELPEKLTHPLKNMYTSPPKKGTYGFPGTTLSKGDEFKYISDPYDAEKRRQALEAKENLKKMQAAPFKSSCKRLDCFDAQPNVGASKIYSLDKPLPARKALLPQPISTITAPFKPSSPPKRGITATIGKPYEYREDPYEAKERHEREQRLRNKPQVVWKPVSTSKSLPVRSIAFNKAQ